jgi:hypothetical protein
MELRGAGVDEEDEEESEDVKEEEEEEEEEEEDEMGRRRGVNVIDVVGVDVPVKVELNHDDE